MLGFVISSSSVKAFGHLQLERVQSQGREMTPDFSGTKFWTSATKLHMSQLALVRYGLAATRKLSGETKVQRPFHANGKSLAHVPPIKKSKVEGMRHVLRIFGGGGGGGGRFDK